MKDNGKLKCSKTMLVQTRLSFYKIADFVEVSDMNKEK